MDRFSALRTLVAAVDGGSLSAASRRLRTPLPTVSRRISDLEAHLGTQLLLRTPRRLILTDAGAVFVPAARRILAALDEAEREASGEYREPVGELLVTAPIAFGRIHILPVVLEFLQAFPGIDVRLAMSDAVVDMIDNHVDVAVRIGRLPDSSLIAQQVGEVRWITVASPAYLAVRGTPEVPADLAEHDCLAFEGLTPSRSWQFAGDAGSDPLTIRPRLGVNTADALVEAASAGLGVARMTSYLAAGALRDGRLVELLKPFVGDPIAVHLVHAPAVLLPLKLRAFLDFVAPQLKAALGDLPR